MPTGRSAGQDAWGLSDSRAERTQENNLAVTQRRQAKALAAAGNVQARRAEVVSGSGRWSGDESEPGSAVETWPQSPADAGGKGRTQRNE